MNDGKYLETIWVCPKCKESRGTECNGPTKCKCCGKMPIAVALYTGHLSTIVQQSLSSSDKASCSKYNCGDSFPSLEDVIKAIHTNEYFTENDIIKEVYETIRDSIKD